MAERVRFELTRLFCSLLDFESSAFGHSATSPQLRSNTAICAFDNTKALMTPNPFACLATNISLPFGLFGGALKILLLFLAAAVLAVSAATLRPDIVDNPIGYANMKSREFAKGENNDHSGWRECVALVSTAREIGVVCEGTRTLLVPGGQKVDVNYFCEIRFLRVDGNWSRVDYVLCQ